MQCAAPVRGGKKTTNLVSRILFQLHHLSGRVITEPILLPTLEPVLQSSNSGEQPSNVPIHGITVPKVYPLPLLPVTAVSSYLTFSPLSHFWCDSYFLWHSLFPGLAGSRRLTGGLLFTVRTFLPDCSERWLGFVACKDKH